MGKGQGGVEVGKEVLGEGPRGVRGGAVCVAVSMGIDPNDLERRVVIMGNCECVDAALHGGGGGEDQWVQDGCSI